MIGGHCHSLASTCQTSRIFLNGEILEDTIESSRDQLNWKTLKCIVVAQQEPPKFWASNEI